MAYINRQGACHEDVGVLDCVLRSDIFARAGPEAGGFAESGNEKACCCFARGKS